MTNPKMFSPQIYLDVPLRLAPRPVLGVFFLLYSPQSRAGGIFLCRFPPSEDGLYELNLVVFAGMGIIAAKASGEQQRTD